MEATLQKAEGSPSVGHVPKRVVRRLHLYELIDAAHHFGGSVVPPAVCADRLGEKGMRVAQFSRAPDRFDLSAQEEPYAVGLVDI